MIGTEKQIQWAEKIKNNFVALVERKIKFYRDMGSPDADIDALRRWVDAICGEEKASRWIEDRYGLGNEAVEHAICDIMREKTPAMPWGK